MQEEVIVSRDFDLLLAMVVVNFASEHHPIALCQRKIVVLADVDHDAPRGILDVKGLTVCVTGGGVGVDNAWEQKKLETRKMLENAAESPPSSARCVGQPKLCKNRCLNLNKLPNCKIIARTSISTTTQNNKNYLRC